MSKPWVHSLSSAKKFGGKPEDYMAIHEKMDSSKAASSKVNHRCMYHHSMGPYMMQDVFGVTIKNSAGKDVIVRDIAEQHIMEDLGFIPSFDEWMQHLTVQPWMAGAKKFKHQIIEKVVAGD